VSKLHFFLTQYVEETFDSLVGRVVINVEVEVLLHERDVRQVFSDHRILVSDVVLFDSVFDDGGESASEGSSRLFAEEVADRGFTSFPDPRNVFEVHRREDVDEDVRGGGCGLFGGSVHAVLEFVELWPEAELSNGLSDPVKLGRDQYLDHFVVEEPVFLAH